MRHEHDNGSLEELRADERGSTQGTRFASAHSQNCLPEFTAGQIYNLIQSFNTESPPPLCGAEWEWLG